MDHCDSFSKHNTHLTLTQQVPGTGGGATIQAKLLAPVSFCLKTTLGFVFSKLTLNTRWMSSSRAVVLHISQTVKIASANLGSMETESKNRGRRPNGDAQATDKAVQKWLPMSRSNSEERRSLYVSRNLHLNELYHQICAG